MGEGTLTLTNCHMCIQEVEMIPYDIWGLPKIRDTILGVPIIRIIVFGDLYLGPPVLGNYFFFWLLVRNWKIGSL